MLPIRRHLDRNCRLFAQLLFPSHKPDNNQQQNHQFFNYPNNHQPRRFSQSSSSAASFTINRKSKMPAFTYPEVRRDESSVETLHGVEVEDPYRWLEDPDSGETKKFVEDQNAITLPFIESCPDREKIKERLTELWDYPKYGCPFRRGDNYFYYMNTGLQNQSVLYIQSSLESEAKVFLDPNTLSEDGTTSINTSAFSEDGKWFAYALSDSGSDWVRIKIRNVHSGQDLEETLEKVKFTRIAWTHDHLGFFYARYPDHSGKSDGTETVANENQKIYYHLLNTPQTQDVLVVEFPEEPKWMSGAVVSDCGKYLHVFVRKGCQDVLWFYSKIPEKIGKLELTPIYTTFDSEFEYVTSDGEVVYARTNKSAPNFRVVKFHLDKVDPASWTDVIPENEKDVLDWCHCVNQDVLVVCYLRDVVSKIELHKLNDGSLIKELDLPIGSVTSFSGKRKQSEIFYYMTSFLTPGLIYHYDFNRHSDPQVFRDVSKVLKNFDASDFIQEQVFYKSTDGTKVPMFIVRQKDTPLDGNNICMLYGYGGFNISIEPSFSVSRILWMRHLNGISAIANLRGGGEYGQKWHDSGRLFNKQNVFDDFISAGEYLVQNNYTSKSKLVIQGGSNGGLLVGACMNQRPDLFAVGIAHVGVMDMLRFHKFTIGHAWITDYGNPDEKDHFQNLIRYSPLHNIPSDASVYPATLLLTADHDDRVVPLHSLKFMAQLQHLLGQKVTDRPLMIRLDTKAGHGAGKPTTKTIEELTDIYCFIEKCLNIRYVD